MENIIELFAPDIYLVKSIRTFKDDYRLNAEYFSHDNNFELDEDIETKKLSEIAQIIGFGPFKRYYINNKSLGIPLISSSGMMELEPSYDSIISKEYNPDWEKYVVNKNTILVSCSGTIGNVTLVDSRLQGMAISQHALRVVLFDEKDIGFIYTFLSSDYGKSLISGKKSGAVIDEIYEDDLNRIDVPIIKHEIRQKLNDVISLAYSKRDTANELIKKARNLVLQYNNLPSLDESEIETLDPEKELEIRQVSIEEFTTDYRLDAHFYNPMAKKAVENIRQYSSKSLPLYDLSDCSFRGGRSARNYVDKEHGTPFLSGKNIIQIRPDLKYLSNTETSNLDEMLIKKNWILITRSGTLARTVYVWNNYEEFAASEHLIRVVPNNTDIDAGYLYAFLSSDYGYHQLLRYKHGAVIDEITEDQISQTLIPISDNDKQKEIGEIMRRAYGLRAEAIQLEDEAQEILTEALTGK
ncbi:MAG: restriction endonuclease subunit S [Bacteroidales bacterium]|nr:restriction endonuclease subunit S [Bacteroidales bacterium]MDD3944765.1 restriction endonuclease subunit S [Bacteroidales bacterium]